MKFLITIEVPGVASSKQNLTIEFNKREFKGMTKADKVAYIKAHVGAECGEVAEALAEVILNA